MAILLDIRPSPTLESERLSVLQVILVFIYIYLKMSFPAVHVVEVLCHALFPAGSQTITPPHTHPPPTPQPGQRSLPL